MSRHLDVFPIPTEWLLETDVLLAQSLSRWAEASVLPHRSRQEEAYGELLQEAMRVLFLEVGLQSLPGTTGAVGGAVTLAVVLEQIGRADVGLGFVVANTLCLQRALARHGCEAASSLMSDTEEPWWATLVLEGYGRESSGAFGMQPPVTARFHEGSWILQGRSPARPQCSGADARFLGVVCELEGSVPALMFVPASVPGLERSEPFKKAGLTASRNADVRVTDVVVPDSYLIFKGQGGLNELLSWYFMACAALSQGGMLAAWSILRDWGQSRVVKGKGQVLKDNPLVASLMGAIGERVCTSRLLVYSLARMLAGPELDGTESSSAVHLATATAVVKAVHRAAVETLDQVMELMGSAGYATEWGLERYWRDLKTLQTYMTPPTAAATTLAGHYFGSEVLRPREGKSSHEND